MPKTAIDPFFALNQDLSAPARFGGAGATGAPGAGQVPISDTQDLPNVTKMLIVTVGTGGTGIAVLFPNDLDSSPVTIPLAAGATYVLPLQVRRIMNTNTALGTNGGVVAAWGG
jgi:hypothetical protein